MKSHLSISLQTYCTFHEIEPVFILDLHQQGLVELALQNNEYFILEHHLPQIERYIQFHYELGINIEGLEVINGLLDRITDLQAQINQLNHR